MPLSFIDSHKLRFTSLCLLNCKFHKLHLVPLLLNDGICNFNPSTMAWAFPLTLRLSKVVNFFVRVYLLKCQWTPKTSPTHPKHVAPRSWQKYPTYLTWTNWEKHWGQLRISQRADFNPHSVAKSADPRQIGENYPNGSFSYSSPPQGTLV